MTNMPISWKVKPILDAHGVTPYKLRQESGLSVAVTYAIANNEHQALDVGVIEKLIPALRRLTGDSTLQIGDILEYTEVQHSSATRRVKAK